jgi:D-tyrosyl-tRNA(Tyr) deacylase
MRLVIQRVTKAKVVIDDHVHSEIGQGILVLLGIEDNDLTEDALWLCQKISAMRIFNDADGKMNLSVTDINGQILVVSQFTLHASTKKGNRPGFIKAAKPETAIPLYELFCSELKKTADLIIRQGVFGADMKVHLVNDGPVTFIMDSKNRE